MGLGGGDLEFVEVGFGAVHTALGLDASAVDGDLSGAGVVVDHRIPGELVEAAFFVEITLDVTGAAADPLFRAGAAAETPGVADEFGGGDFLDGAGRGEVLPEGVAEVVVGFFFVGVNAVVEGEEAEFGGVGGGFFFAFGGFGSGGGFCVGAVRVDLRFSCHGGGCPFVLSLGGASGAASGWERRARGPAIRVRFGERNLFVFPLPGEKVAGVFTIWSRGFRYVVEKMGNLG